MTDFSMKRTWGPTPVYTNVLAHKGLPNQDNLIVIAGPCSVESKEQIKAMSEFLAWNPVTFARGGLFRAGTYPRADFGLKTALMRAWASNIRKKGLRTIIEIIDLRQIEKIDPYADAFQVGARHCQDYVLLKELSQTKKPVTLKRGMGMTLDEFLGAAEYLARGRCSPILIERGSATSANHVRWDLSLSIIPTIKSMGIKLPVLVDASHGTGRRDLVAPMTLAGVAAGADGFVIEIHPDPEKSLSDADQAVDIWKLPDIISKAKSIKKIINRSDVFQAMIAGCEDDQ